MSLNFQCEFYTQQLGSGRGGGGDNGEDPARTGSSEMTVKVRPNPLRKGPERGDFLLGLGCDRGGGGLIEVLARCH